MTWCITVPILGIQFFCYIVICVALVWEAWDEPTPEDYQKPLHPPPDVMAAGAAQMALEMREWADESPTPSPTPFFYAK